MRPDAAFGLATPAAYSQSTVTNESATITITQLIYDGGRTIAAIRSAKEADIAGRATLLRQLQTLALNVANAYYAVLENNATVTADAQLVHEFEVNEASVAAQIRNGAAARSDIAAAQFQTAQARGNLVTAQGAAIGSQASFATTLGLDADALVVPKQLMAQPAAPNPSYAASLKRALIMRPDFIAANYTVQSDQENLRFAKLARFPTLAAAASDGVSRQFIDCFSTTVTDKHGNVTPISACPTGSTAPNGIPSSWTNDKSLGLSLTIPIYDQGVTNFNVAQAASQLDQAIASFNLTRLTVESDVRSALGDLDLVACVARAGSLGADLGSGLTRRDAGAVSSRRDHDSQRGDGRGKPDDGAVGLHHGALRRADGRAKLFVRYGYQRRPNLGACMA